MTADPNTPVHIATSPTRVIVVKPKRKGVKLLVAVAILVLVGAIGARAWESGFRLHDLWRTRPEPLALVMIDEGDIEVSVIESGTLEPASNSKVKCQVEALLGTISNSSGSTRTLRNGATSTSGAGGAGSTSSSGNASATTSATKAKSSARSKMGGAASKTSGGSSTASSSGSGSSSGSASASSGSASGGGSGSSSSGSTTTGTQSKKPTIRSFSYQVAKYTPLRPATSKSGSTSATSKTSTTASAGMAGGGGAGGGGRGGGGGGGGRGGGGGGGNRGGGGGGGGGMGQESQGSTRIIQIIPEGTSVHAGDLVCELESSAFRDELAAQKIKHAQAKAWVDQAKTIYEVNQITYKEYVEGIFPQDVGLIEQYITSCEVEYQRAFRTAEWSRDTMNKGFRASAQYMADEMEVQRCEIALREARGMKERLNKYTKPRLMKALEAKLESIRSDMLAQEAAFGLEDDRLRRLLRIIEHCTIRAPRDGVVVYANESDAWSGRVEVQIQEGATVREGQAIFDLPNPKHKRVKVKINESKLATIRSGQKASILIEAFPDKPLLGTVTEITPIPAVLGRFSDVRVYYAFVDLDLGGFEGLRPGMSAQASFFVDRKEKITRVPVESLRWVAGQPYIAVAATVAGETKWDWRPITLGLMGNHYAQVLSGLNAGENVVARPDKLPAPEAPKAAEPEVQTADTTTNAPRG